MGHRVDVFKTATTLLPTTRPRMVQQQQRQPRATNTANYGPHNREEARKMNIKSNISERRFQMNKEHKFLKISSIITTVRMLRDLEKSRRWSNRPKTWKKKKRRKQNHSIVSKSLDQTYLTTSYFQHWNRKSYCHPIHSKHRQCANKIRIYDFQYSNQIVFSAKFRPNTESMQIWCQSWSKCKAKDSEMR